jgi:DNA-binding MarR family transcriptional regulator
MVTTPPDMLCFALHSTAHAVHAAYAPLLQPLGLTYPQYLVLMSLSAQEGRTVGQLGTELRLDTNTMTPLLKRMEKAGLVRRGRNPQDERQVRLSLTERAASVPRAFAERTGFQFSELADLRDILLALRDRLKPAKP